MMITILGISLDVSPISKQILRLDRVRSLLFLLLLLQSSRLLSVELHGYFFYCDFFCNNSF